MEIVAIKETCLYTEDLLSAVNFYNEILEFPVISHIENKHAFFRAGNSVLLCFNPKHSKLKQHPPPHYATGRQHIAFEVAVDQYFEIQSMLVAKGVKILDKLIWESGQESFYFEDPAGHLLEIVPVGIWEMKDEK